MDSAINDFLSKSLTTENLQAILIWAVLLGLLGFRFYRFRQVKAKIPLLVQQGATFIDVRTPKEYAAGSRSGSLNIPLNHFKTELDGQLNKLDKKKPVVVSCVSGTRGRAAAAFLRRNGFTHVVNAGSWKNTV